MAKPLDDTITDPDLRRDLGERALRVAALDSAVAYGCAILSATSTKLDDKSIATFADEMLEWLKAGDD